MEAGGGGKGMGVRDINTTGTGRGEEPAIGRMGTAELGMVLYDGILGRCGDGGELVRTSDRLGLTPWSIAKQRVPPGGTLLG